VTGNVGPAKRKKLGRMNLYVPFTSTVITPANGASVQAVLGIAAPVFGSAL